MYCGCYKHQSPKGAAYPSLCITGSSHLKVCPKPSFCCWGKSWIPRCSSENDGFLQGLYSCIKFFWDYPHWSSPWGYQKKPQYPVLGSTILQVEGDAVRHLQTEVTVACRWEGAPLLSSSVVLIIYVMLVKVSPCKQPRTVMSVLFFSQHWSVDYFVNALWKSSSQSVVRFEDYKWWCITFLIR